MIFLIYLSQFLENNTIIQRRKKEQHSATMSSQGVQEFKEKTKKYFFEYFPKKNIKTQVIYEN